MSENEDIFEQEATVVNKLGLHARPAAMIVKTANEFDSEIYISKMNDSEIVNGKSIMGVMMLAASKGTRLLIRAEGCDCEDAVNRIVEVINSKFGEE